ncbi:hypothetical protein CXB51_013659 [Gossypium anomalum]|uniref:Nucleoside diphosphate kinase-like domain-containing protein n=1 Tax=Gossypium anomalum TaxID=47600 RepID=A0A8J5YWF3_9ROSI|nr:hypothetical protein CXB51_013659 [Gossypium anomalum]
MTQFLTRFFFFSMLIIVLRCYSSTGRGEKERTLGIIKPDGLSGNYTNRIKQVIMESGFEISKEMVIQLDEQDAANFYAEHSSKIFFTDLIRYMTGIRAMCGIDLEKNCIHGSDSHQSAEREIAFFFKEAPSDEAVRKHDEL